MDKGKSKDGKDGKDGKESMEQGTQTWALSSPYFDPETMLAVTLANLELVQQKGQGDAAAGKGKGQGQGRGYIYLGQPYILDKGMIKGKGKGMDKDKDMDDYDFGNTLGKDKGKGKGKDDDKGIDKGKDKDKGQDKDKGMFNWMTSDYNFTQANGHGYNGSDDYDVFTPSSSSNELDFDPMIIEGSGKGKGK